MTEPTATALPGPYEQETIEAFRRPEPFSVPALVTALLLVVFVAAAFGTLRSPLDVLLLVAVVTLHEAGHAAGMRIFGFRDVKMFFLPFFGAAVVGRPRGAAAWKDALVSLLGPLPGLLLAVAVFALALRQHEPVRWPFRLAELLFLLNAFNLLPLGFLDGGRFFLRTIFARHRVLALAFEALGSLALVAIAVQFRMVVLGLFTLFALRGLPRRWRVLGAAAAFRVAHPAASADPDRLTEPELLSLLEHSRAAERGGRDLPPAALAGTMEHVLDASQRSPGVFATLGLLVLYAVSLVCVLACTYLHVLALGPESWTAVPLGTHRAELPRPAGPIALMESGRDSTWRVVLDGVERFSIEKCVSDTSEAAAAERLARLERETRLRPARSGVPEDGPPGAREHVLTGARRELRARTFVAGGVRWWLVASAPEFGPRQRRFLDSFAPRESR